MIASLQTLFERDLKRLYGEIASFNPDYLWNTKGRISNSAGNLCLHLCGNLQYYIGAVLGTSGYVRNRKAEFETRGIAVERLLKEINRAQSAVAETLSKIDSSTLDADYPERVFGEAMSVRFFLIHLQGHLNYHLGQINYLRRMLDSAVS